mmetsp:Transcript_892/g.2439  ORF Transcript_892/g.2439 Transcript_892/m.2439 type:complete len:305 (+) Transcript_892:699-1613(+)
MLRRSPGRAVPREPPLATASRGGRLRSLGLRRSSLDVDHRGRRDGGVVRSLGGAFLLDALPTRGLVYLRLALGVAHQHVARLLIDVQLELAAVAHKAAKHRLGDGILAEPLDGAAEGARAIRLGEAAAADELRELGRPRHLDALLVTAVRKVLEHQAGDGLHLGRHERFEDDHLVEAVEELGAEGGAELLLDGRAHRRVRLVAALAAAHLQNPLGAHVGREDEHRVREVDDAPLVVGEPSVLEDLEKDVEDVGVGLLDLVHQDHRVRRATHRLRQLAARLVADVPRRRPCEPRDGVRLHVLRHV